MITSSRRLAFVVFMALSSAACDQNPPPSPPSAEAELELPTDRDAIHVRFMVLVDLSETWHNDPARQRNMGLLSAVNAAVATAAEAGNNNPAAISYYLISANNYFAEVHCNTTYTLALIPGEDGYYARGPLLEYLDTCARAALERPTENVTPIFAAIATAAETMRDAPGQEPTAKRIVILSDLKEESGPPPPHDPNDLAGFDVIVLFRALPEDQRDPALLQQRIRSWRQELSGRGARVTSARIPGSPRTTLHGCSVQVCKLNQSDIANADKR